VPLRRIAVDGHRFPHGQCFLEPLLRSSHHAVVPALSEVTTGPTCSIRTQEFLPSWKCVDFALGFGDLLIEFSKIDLPARPRGHPVPVPDPVWMLGDDLLLFFLRQRIPPSRDVARSNPFALRRIRRR